ncbi:MAG TPA: exosortase B [Caldimonas sp.]|nr:exosortase B [Caldimonas sp.]HEX2542191.1 exosortase B [Caldimonas sp.]
MSSVLPGSFAGGSAGFSRHAAWLIAIAGFAVMYVPVYWWAGTTIWQSDEQAHGALILAVLLWLFWGLREEIAALPDASAPGWGWPLFAFGLFLYFVGRVSSVLMLAIASQAFVAAGVLLLMKGRASVRLAWFPLVYFVFMIPLPGTLVDAITGPLKHWISVLVVELLYSVGYPISRNGVVLTIGQYQMLVADACSGLHSMYSLSALGTLFMYIMRRSSTTHNVVMLLSILPIAFLANMVRVIALVLITYHMGDEAGQGFLHGAAGMVLMLVALAFFFALDAILARVLRGTAPRAAAATVAADAAGTKSLS